MEGPRERLREGVMVSAASARQAPKLALATREGAAAAAVTTAAAASVPPCPLLRARTVCRRASAPHPRTLSLCWSFQRQSR